MDKHLQLVHVSDLHFGDNILSPSWSLTAKKAGGLAVHDLNAAIALTDSVDMQRLASGLPTSVVATGDLTTWGRRRAFGTARTFLRGRAAVSALKFAGLNDPGSAVVPGNHDIWSVMTRYVVGSLGLPLTVRGRFDHFFNPPVPAPHSGSYFPYGVRIPCGPVAVYLYGLDSNRLELAPHSLATTVGLSILASGYVQPAQLDELENVCLPGELDEPRIRLAAIHHPLAYASTGAAPWGPIKKLINLDYVLGRLQDMGFAAALVGHEHSGFVQMASMPYKPRPLYVLSAGTSTQLVYLDQAERALVATDFADLDPNDRPAWEAAMAETNEYRTYVFESDPDADFTGKHLPPDALVAEVKVFKYNPGVPEFRQLAPSGGPYYVRLGDYIIN